MRQAPYTLEQVQIKDGDRGDGNHLREGDWVSHFRSIDPEEIVIESGKL